jgi:hypothetical protein
MNWARARLEAAAGNFKLGARGDPAACAAAATAPPRGAGGELSPPPKRRPRLPRIWRSGQGCLKKPARADGPADRRARSLSLRYDGRCATEAAADSRATRIAGTLSVYVGGAVGHGRGGRWRLGGRAGGVIPASCSTGRARGYELVVGRR